MLLEIGREGEPGKPFEWSGETELVIGRGRDAGMMIPDPLLSRRHCKLERRGGLLFVSDLGSANGSFLNGVQITRAEAKPGDIVTVGKSWVRIVPDVAKVKIAAGADSSPSGLTTKRVDPRIAPTSPERKLAPQISDEEIYPEIEGYKIQAAIGRGSFGTVYRAVNKKSGRPVAIKVIPTGAAAKQETVARFLREIDAMGQLRHPNLVQVHGAGEGDHFAYLIMEFVDGETLARKVQAEGRFETWRALEIARQIAAALEHAFSRGYVHRDVKPENILLDPVGTAKLCDFGLVKNLATSSSHHLTRPGQGFGSLAYMPPEQVRDAVSADQRADVYSLGATLYNLLTGRRPFTGQVNKGFVKKVLEEYPDPIVSIEPTTPKDIVRIVERCMQKDPALRYQSPRELREALETGLKALETGLQRALPPDPEGPPAAAPAAPPVDDAAATPTPAAAMTASLPPAPAGALPVSSFDVVLDQACESPGGASSARLRRSSSDSDALAEFAEGVVTPADSRPRGTHPELADPAPSPPPVPEAEVRVKTLKVQKPPGDVAPPPAAPAPAAPALPAPTPTPTSASDTADAGLVEKLAKRLFGRGKRNAAWLLVLGLTAALAAFARADEAPETLTQRLRKAKLPGVPAGWTKVDDMDWTYDSVHALGRRLGSRVQRMATQIFESPAGTIQVNTMLAASDDDAAGLEVAARNASAASITCRDGRIVYEIVAGSRAAKEAALAHLPVPEGPRADAIDRLNGGDGRIARWRAEVRVARLARPADRAAAHRLSTLLFAAQALEAARAPRTDIDALAGALGPEAKVPGRSWLVRTGQGAALGVPHVVLSGEVEAPRADHTPPGPAALAPARAWPSGDAAVRARVDALKLPGDPLARVEALFHATRSAVRPAAVPTGARDPALDVLARGSGQAWEVCDVFVTLARAAGVPAREIAGWRAGKDGGPVVWGEAYVPGKGWIGLDLGAPPGSPGRVGRDHVPLFLVEDGELPILHCAPARLERVPRPVGK